MRSGILCRRASGRDSDRVARCTWLPNLLGDVLAPRELSSYSHAAARRLFDGEFVAVLHQLHVGRSHLPEEGAVLGEVACEQHAEVFAEWLERQDEDFEILT